MKQFDKDDALGFTFMQRNSQRYPSEQQIYKGLLVEFRNELISGSKLKETEE